jgi:hypothetical protein
MPLRQNQFGLYLVRSDLASADETSRSLNKFEVSEFTGLIDPIAALCSGWTLQ